jgi:hypothetical protein
MTSPPRNPPGPYAVSFSSPWCAMVAQRSGQWGEDERGHPVALWEAVATYYWSASCPDPWAEAQAEAARLNAEYWAQTARESA